MIRLNVNGRTEELDADPATPLLYVLRDYLHLNGAKFGCGLGQCCACTVLVDGRAVFSCVTPVSTLDGRRVTTLEADGNEMPDGSFGEPSLTITGNAFASRGMGDDYAGTIEIDSRATPKTFDLLFTAGPPAGERNRGIYKLDGDVWTICLATRGDDRPKQFATMSDTGHALETLEREATTPKKARKPSKAARVAEEPPSGPPTEIEGEWAMVSAVLNGKPLAPEMVKYCKRVTRGNVTKILAGPQTMLDASFTLDAKQRHIDYVNRSGPKKGKAQQGIYSLRGDRLEICTADPGLPRPGDLSSSNGDGRSYTVWTRAGK